MTQIMKPGLRRQAGALELPLEDRVDRSRLLRSADRIREDEAVLVPLCAGRQPLLELAGAVRAQDLGNLLGKFDIAPRPAGFERCRCQRLSVDALELLKHSSPGAHLRFLVGGSVADQRSAPSVAARNNGENEYDFHRALELVEEDHLKILLRETERIVAEHWREVEAVAAALLERESLTALELYKVVVEARRTAQAQF